MDLREICPVALPTVDTVPAVAELPVEVHLDPGCLGRLPMIAASWTGERPLTVADPQTLAASGLRPPDLDALVLPPHPHADDETVAEVARAAQGRTGLVAVGAGTINDLCKRAAHLLGIPFVVCGTAASMNGYASAIAALLSDGVKTTVPARPARALVLDPRVLAAAPPALTQAGLGDLLSKPVSDTDWWLSDAWEGTGYSTLPGEIVDAAVETARAAAGQLAAGDLDAHAALGRALVLSGVAMVVAGSSSPASGGEHLISHLWDMEAHRDGRPTRLHGAQVGVATCITAALYQRLLEVETVPDRPAPDWTAEAARMRATHGALAHAILPHAERKHARANGRRQTLQARWPALRQALAARRLPASDAVRAPLRACGAPSTLAELGVPRADALRALCAAADIRDRLTVLDLALDLGVLPAAAEEILDAAGV